MIGLSCAAYKHINPFMHAALIYHQHTSDAVSDLSFYCQDKKYFCQ